MSLSRTAWGHAIDETSASALAKLGELREYAHPTYGRQIYRYILNKSGGALALGLGVMQENGTDICEVSLSGANCEAVRLLGVAQHAIASTYYGWVLASGVGQFQSDGSTTANTAQQAAANGQFTDGVVGADELVVWAQETESPAGANGLFRGIVRAL